MFNNKEIHFDLYCCKCEHSSKNEIEEPCNECLQNPVRENSHKPLNFKEVKK